MIGNTNFTLRLVSSLILAPFALYCLYLGGIYFYALTFLFVLIGTIELATIITQKRMTTSVVVSVIVTQVMVLLIFYKEVVLLGLLMMLGGLTIVLVERFSSAHQLQTRDVALMIVGILYIGLMGGAGLLIRENPAGLLLWILMVSATWSADTMAYAGGRTYGKTPMAPTISPKKTVEGAVTGIVASIVISLIMLYVWQVVFSVTLVIIILAPFASVLGDLLISKLKRMYDIKDSAYRHLNIMPGHGGVLDRIDSLALVVLSSFVVLILFGVL